MLHDVYTPQRRDVIEKSTEIVLGVTGGYAFCHLSILAKTITTRKRGWHARNISAGAEWRFPRKSEMHYVRDVGVAGSNPVTPTIEFGSIPGRWVTAYRQRPVRSAAHGVDTSGN